MKLEYYDDIFRNTLGASMKIIYVSYLKKDYSRSAVHFECLQRNQNLDLIIEYVQFPKGIFSKIRLLSKMFHEYKNLNPIFLVMSPASTLVIYLRLFGFRRIIFDGGWPLSDAAKIREISKINKLFIWLIDFITIHLATYYICESNEQRNFVKKEFFVNLTKLKVIYTGFAEPLIQNNPRYLQSLKGEFGSRQYVFFRGKPNNEAGLNTILKAAQLLEGSVNFIIAAPDNAFESQSNNVLIINTYLPWSDIAALYREAYVVLGQMSDLDRITRTIPHKFFEAAYFGKAYLTAFSIPLRNLTNKGIFEIKGGDAIDLANKITFLLDNPNLVAQFEKDLKQLYENKLAPNFLAEQILEIAREIN